MNQHAENEMIASGLRPLPKTFSPSINEVIIGRGRKVVNHSGNIRFKELIQSHLQEYSKANRKASKSATIVRVLMIVKQGSPVGGFVKQDASTKRWYALEDASARISTAQAFRDALSGSYRSSKQYKQRRRWNLKCPPKGGGSNTTHITNTPSNDGGDCSAAMSSHRVSKASEVTAKSYNLDSTVVKTDTPVRAFAPLSFPSQTAQTYKGGLEGIKGILGFALDLIDDDDLKSDGETTTTMMIPGRGQSPFQVAAGDDLKIDHLGALLDRVESSDNQVQWTENPYEPRPLMLLQNTQGSSAPNNAKPTAAYSMESRLTLRNFLAFGIEI